MMDCPHCGVSIADDLVVSTAAKINVSKRKNNVGGRPLSKSPRCACGKMTARLAEIRHHHCTIQQISTTQDSIKQQSITTESITDHQSLTTEKRTKHPLSSTKQQQNTTKTRTKQQKITQPPAQPASNPPSTVPESLSNVKPPTEQPAKSLLSVLANLPDWVVGQFALLGGLRKRSD